MRITDITQQERNRNRVSIYVDGSYRFSLTRDQLAESGLQIGATVTDSDISRFQQQSEFGAIRDSLYRWLALRPRSRWEVETYINRKTDNQILRESLLNHATNEGYTNDIEFAAMWIRDRQLLRPMSKLRIKRELTQKRIPLEIIEDQLNSSGYDDEPACRAIIEKKRLRYRGDRKAMIAYLLRQGFAYDTIQRCMADSSNSSSY